MNALTTLRVTNQVVGTLAPGLAARLARRLLMTPRAHRMRDHERAAFARAEPITFRFGLGGLRWGRSGPVVLALHGWEGRPTQFAAMIAPLLAAGRQVIALEAPGHGRSPGRESNVFRFAEALLEAAVEIREVESVVGHSMGGSAALYAASQGLPVERAVAIASPAALARVLDRFAAWIALPPAARREFRAAIDAHVGVRAEDFDVERLAPQLGLGTLFVHDRGDREVPFDESERWVATLPEARLIATTGLGHGRILSDPPVVAAITAFLCGGPPRGP